MRAILSIVFLALMAGLLRAETRPSGDWVGLIGEGKDAAPLRCHISENTTGYAGTITLPTYDLIEQAITEIESHPPKIILRIKKESAWIELNGQISGEKISGMLRAAEKTSSFEMFHVAPSRIEDYFGVFAFPNGHHIYIRTWDELGTNQLAYFTDDGRAGALHATGKDLFTSGPGLWIPLPVMVKVQFARDDKGNVASLRWVEEGKEQFAKKQLLKEEEINFANKNVLLAGSLVTPAEKAPVAAVVLVHGSGPVTRDFFGPIGYVLAQHGIAALSYDKRGNGKSQGDWLDIDFSDLANDALAAVAYLKTRKEIDPHRIGLWGISQGGWIVPLAVSQSKDVSFVVLLSTPSGTPIDQEVQSTQEEMKLQGATEEQIKTATTQLMSQIDSLRGEETKKELESEVIKLQQAGDKQTLASNGAQNPKFLLFYRRIMDFDPAPYLKRLSCPTLILYGESDRGVPVSANRSKLEGYLKEAGNKDYLIRVFPKGNHAMMLAETGARLEFFHLKQFVPGFFDVMLEWMQARK